MLPLEPSLRQGSAPGLEFQVLSSSVNCPGPCIAPSEQELPAGSVPLSQCCREQAIHQPPPIFHGSPSILLQTELKTQNTTTHRVEQNTQQNVKASQTTSLSPVGRSLSQIWEIPHMQRAGLFKGCSCHSSAPCIRVFLGESCLHTF